MVLFVGDDWAEDHHDVYLMDEAGARVAAQRLPEGMAGIAELHELIAAHAEEPGEVVVGIEPDRGLWVNALSAAGYLVFAINPMAVARYRDRHRVSGAKSDAADAKLLADLVRTDRHNHRPLDGDSPEAEAVKVLARAHQNLIWARARHIRMLRSALREYYPAALQAFDDLGGRDALAVLGRAPTPHKVPASVSARSVQHSKLLDANAVSIPAPGRFSRSCVPSSWEHPRPSPRHSGPPPAPRSTS